MTHALEKAYVSVLTGKWDWPAELLFFLSQIYTARAKINSSPGIQDKIVSYVSYLAIFYLFGLHSA